MTNSDINCFENYSDTINVVCPVIAAFELTSNVVPVNELVTLTNNSINGNSYEWLVSGSSQGSDSDFSFSLANPTVVQLCLQVTGQFCIDTHCELVNITEVNDADCELTFFKAFGDPLKDEGASVITESSDGGYILEEIELIVL